MRRVLILAAFLVPACSSTPSQEEVCEANLGQVMQFLGVAYKVREVGLEAKARKWEAEAAHSMRRKPECYSTDELNYGFPETWKQEEYIRNHYSGVD